MQLLISVANAVEAKGNPLGLPIGSQVWPTRSMLKDFPAYVNMMADIGVSRLELCSPIGYGDEFASYIAHEYRVMAATTCSPMAPPVRDRTRLSL